MKENDDKQNRIADLRIYCEEQGFDLPVDLKELTEKQLIDFMEAFGEKSFRGRQIYKWINKGACSFDEMTDISAGLREKLKENACIGSLTLLRRQESSDGTVKFLFGLKDGNAIETVFMKYKYGNSICVSSQAGCRMGCTFCASGKLGLARNLTHGEIAGQIFRCEEITGQKINHVVVMGTGEPFDNYDNLAEFIRRINDKNGLNIGMRNITVSTCGLVNVIERFAADFPQVNLAVSLHAPTDEQRSRTMPVNRKYPLSELIQACRRYTEQTHRRITFEYAVIKDENDRDEDIEKLAELLRGILCHVNLIPLNEIEEKSDNRAGSRQRAGEIAEMLESRGITATVRRSLGRDIDAACGQLRLNESFQRTIIVHNDNNA